MHRPFTGPCPVYGTGRTRLCTVHSRGPGPVNGTGRTRKWDGIDRMVVGWLDVGLGPGNGTGLEGDPF